MNVWQFSDLAFLFDYISYSDLNLFNRPLIHLNQLSNVRWSTLNVWLRNNSRTNVARVIYNHNLLYGFMNHSSWQILLKVFLVLLMKNISISIIILTLLRIRLGLALNLFLAPMGLFNFNLNFFKIFNNQSLFHLKRIYNHAKFSHMRG